MKISVIIPTFKPQDYLWDCLSSLNSQTFPKSDFEVILVLNGCTEPWKQQIEKYIDEYLQSVNVVFIHTEQRGVSNARNIALDAARGEYVAFIDDDDFVSPQYLSGLYQLADNNTIALCYPYAFNDGSDYVQLPYIITSEYDKLSGRGKTEYRKARRYFGGPWMKLIPMSYIGKRRFDPNFNNGEDSLFMFLISDRYKYVKTAEKDCIYYRRYRDNSAYTKKQSWLQVAKNEYGMARYYTKIYLSNLNKYSFLFYITRILGLVKSIVILNP